MKYVIAFNYNWYAELSTNIQSSNYDFEIITDKADLTFKRLHEFNPKYVFFPHWSYIIPAEIHENFECVIFHMTDVPFGRGGSPLQNLISRGIYETKITALKCVKGIDAGPVYMKEPLSLYGSAEEIYLRAGRVIEKMILKIIETNPIPVAQQGEAVCFPRRKPEESDISALTGLNQLHDHIRMLDAEGYPKAFLETEHFRFEFQRASLKHGKIVSDVVITRKNKNE